MFNVFEQNLIFLLKVTDKSSSRRQKVYENINLSGRAINDEIGEPSSLDNFPTNQASGCISTHWKTSRGRLATYKKTRILERIPFESQKPFFKVLMQPTYVGSKVDLIVSFSIYHIQPAIYSQL